MASRHSKENIVNKLGVKLNGLQTAEEICKLRKENAYLKKSLEELSRQKGVPTDSENNKLLLERILSLETLREINSQQILARDQELGTLRQQLRTGGGEMVASLQAQLNQHIREAEMREKLFQSLKAETEEVKNKLVAVSAKCQEFETKDGSCLQSCSSDVHLSPRDATVVQELLNDALEKNQQWLAYDQQRENYVKEVLARRGEQEQQLNQANEALQQQHREVNSEERRSNEMQKCYEELLQKAQGELELEQERAARAQRECEARQREVGEVRRQIQAERRSSRRSVEEERRRSGDLATRLQAELENSTGQLEEERLRSAELLQQVNLQQKSLLNQHEQQERIAVLEQQIQLSAKDLEDEKLDNQHLQCQLHKVLKELRKAKDQKAQLESECQKAQREAHTCDLGAYAKLEKPQSKESGLGIASPPRVHDLLDESFLECPNCRLQYPTSRHRELLVHIDLCFG